MEVQGVQLLSKELLLDITELIFTGQSFPKQHQALLYMYYLTQFS